jgi:neurofibromin 1
MEALLVLHQPEKIEVWNPEAPINTFWDVRWNICVLFTFSLMFWLNEFEHNIGIPTFNMQIIKPRNSNYIYYNFCCYFTE